MDIGAAVAAIRRGELIRRRGWNGTGMYLYFVPGHVGDPKHEAVKTMFSEGEKTLYADSVMMFTAQRNIVPWLCSQTDLLATDWELI